MEIRIYAEALDPWHELQDYHTEIIHLTGQFGATSVFVGTMRDFNEGDEVKGMFLEYYPGMTEKQLEKIAAQAMRQWPVLDVLLIHRVGEIFPDDPIVLVAVWSSHRGDAFDASRYIMEALKTQAPFWKKEILQSGDERWLEENTDGYNKQPHGR